jgi:hypothetical protein
VRSAGKVAVVLVAIDDGLHGAGDAAEIGAVDVGVDIEDGLHVVMADGAQLGAGDDAGEVAEDVDGLGRSREPAGVCRAILSAGP